MKSDLSLFTVQKISGKIKLPSGKTYLDKADKCMMAAIFFWCVVNMISKHIVISYANIYLKKGIMQYKVLKFNKLLTNIRLAYFQYLRKN